MSYAKAVSGGSFSKVSKKGKSKKYKSKNFKRKEYDNSEVDSIKEELSELLVDPSGEWLYVDSDDYGYLFKYIDGELKLMKFSNEKEAFVAWCVMRHKMNSGRKAKIIEKYFRTFNKELYSIDLHKLALD